MVAMATTEQTEPRTIEQPTADLEFANARVATVEGLVVSASRNQRQTATTLTHFQNEKVRLQLEVGRLTPTLHGTAEDAAAEPSGAATSASNGPRPHGHPLNEIAVMACRGREMGLDDATGHCTVAGSTKTPRPFS
jgi:hypothetical protein